MPTPKLNIRSGHPDFLDLDWSRSVTEWDPDRLVDLPTGIHRHEIVFVPYLRDIYAVKEMSLELARHEWQMLRGLRDRDASVVEPVGIVERPWIPPDEEGAGAVITRYLDYTFSYRELIEGGGFGPRRNQMLDAFANLLVELHLLGAFWGDCSLSNVLYRYDAEALQVTMVDAETVSLHDRLTEGQRTEDLHLMIENVAGGMADIAASQDIEVDAGDLALGDDIALRYEGLWHELTRDEEIRRDETYKIHDRVERLNAMGFEVEDVEIVPGAEGESRLRLRLKVGGRRFHAHRLYELARVEATERQARQILSDLHYHHAKQGTDSPAGKAVAAVQWRVNVFEPLLVRIEQAMGPSGNPVQGYADFLHHRYLLAEQAGRDIETEEAFEDWLVSGRPGYPLS